MILFISLTISSSFLINASSYRLWLASHVKQSYSNWCCAATSQMMGEHYNMYNYKTQSQIVYKMHGNYNNETCQGTEELKVAVKYSTGINGFEVAQPHIGFPHTKIEIDNNRPLLISSIFHVVYIRGYDTDGEKVYISDPLKDYAEWVPFSSVASYNTIMIKRS